MFTRKLAPGTLVALTSCHAWRNGSEVCVSGLYELVEHEGVDGSSGFWSPGWIALPENVPPDLLTDDHAVFIEDLNLLEQIDPSGYGRYIAEEREAELAQYAEL